MLAAALLAAHLTTMHPAISANCGLSPDPIACIAAADPEANLRRSLSYDCSTDSRPDNCRSVQFFNFLMSRRPDRPVRERIENCASAAALAPGYDYTSARNVCLMVSQAFELR